MGNLAVILSNIRKELSEVDSHINTITILLANEGHFARNRNEISFVAHFLQIQKIISKIVYDEKRAEEFIRGTEKLLLKRF